MFLLKVINSVSVPYSVIKTNWCGLLTVLRLVNKAVSLSSFILSALLSMTIKQVTKHFLSDLCELCWHSDVKHRGISQPGGVVGLSFLNKHCCIPSTVMTVFAGSWRWQQESGSWRSAPSALSREFPAVMWSNRPSWAPHTVSLVTQRPP